MACLRSLAVLQWPSPDSLSRQPQTLSYVRTVGQLAGVRMILVHRAMNPASIARGRSHSHDVKNDQRLVLNVRKLKNASEHCTEAGYSKQSLGGITGETS